MATLLDTSALTVLIRRSPPPAFDEVRRAARDEVGAGRALVGAVTGVELLIGARDSSAARRLSELLDLLPMVAADREVAMAAGRMGAEAPARGATIPVPDLLIAATAIWLDLPLLTCDSDSRVARRWAKRERRGGAGYTCIGRRWCSRSAAPVLLPVQSFRQANSCRYGMVALVADVCRPATVKSCAC